MVGRMFISIWKSTLGKMMPLMAFIHQDPPAPAFAPDELILDGLARKRKAPTPTHPQFKWIQMGSNNRYQYEYEYQYQSQYQ